MNKKELIELCKKNGIKGYSRKTKEELIKYIHVELQKRMDAHWEITKTERKRSHSGVMYERYMQNKNK